MRPTAKFWLIGEELEIVGKPYISGGCTVAVDHSMATELARACPIGSFRRGYWEGVSSVLSVQAKWPETGFRDPDSI